MGFRLCEVSKVVKLTEAESRTEVARGWGEGEGGDVVQGAVSAMQDEKVLHVHTANSPVMST